MKESYEERLAVGFGLPRRGVCGNTLVLSVRCGGPCRPAIELRNPYHPSCRSCSGLEKATPTHALLVSMTTTRRSRRPWHAGDIPSARTGRSHRSVAAKRFAVHCDSGPKTPHMNADGKSDESVVPTTSANNDAAEASAESNQGRLSATRNTVPSNLARTPSRNKRRSSGLHGTETRKFAD